jgi:hypothetical protein
MPVSVLADEQDGRSRCPATTKNLAEDHIREVKKVHPSKPVVVPMAQKGGNVNSEQWKMKKDEFELRSRVGRCDQ